MMEQLEESSSGCNDSAVMAEVREELKQDLWNKLIGISHNLGRAMRSAHGGATVNSLRVSYDALQEVMLYLNSAVQTKDSQKFEQQLQMRYGRNYVCPEVYKGENYGYPFFHEGFVMEKCSQAKPLSKVVTLLLNFLDGSGKIHDADILRAVERTYPGLTVIVAAKRKLRTASARALRVQLYTNLTRLSTGDVWNFLISKVVTPFVLIGRDLVHFSNDSRLERLIREADSLQVDVVGGARRTSNGHWSMGCQQVTLRNYTLHYRSGYDLSMHECVYCDHISGAFVANTKSLRSFPLAANVSSSVLFEKFFLDLQLSGRHSTVCPDAMFHMDAPRDSVLDYRSWLPIARKLHIVKVQLADGATVDIPCSELPKCEKVKGLAVSPCCAQHLSDMVKFVMQNCEQQGIICELQEGTLLGAVKMNKVLPWDQDADVTFLSANYSALAQLRTKFKSAGYQLSEGGDLWCCVDNKTAGGKFIVTTPAGWHVELYGQHFTDTERLISQGLKPTKVMFDGQWVGAPANPGLYARNRYGYEVYKHAQHWMNLGHESGWQSYHPAQFSRCPRVGHHACLDQYSVDGNLQFEDPLL